MKTNGPGKATRLTKSIFTVVCTSYSVRKRQPPNYTKCPTKLELTCTTLHAIFLTASLKKVILQVWTRRHSDHYIPSQSFMRLPREINNPLGAASNVAPHMLLMWLDM